MVNSPLVALSIISTCLISTVSSHSVRSDSSSHSPILKARSQLPKRPPSWYQAQFKRQANTTTTTTPATGEGSCQSEASLVAELLPVYPNITGVASLVQGDSQAQDLYNKMIANKSLTALSIPPKGNSGASETGLFTGFTYNASDPDCWWTFNTCTKPKASYLPREDVNTCPEPATWGLTFDDGPSCLHGPLYDDLKKNNQKATMFFIGLNVLSFPLEAQRALADGHELCGHSWSHHYTTALTTEQVFAELYYTKKAIKDVTGVTSRCWRPPYGDVDDRVRTIAGFLDLETIIWDQDTDDWLIDEPGHNATEVQNNFETILKNVSQVHGAIVLNHELNKDDMDMFVKMYPEIVKTYKNVVPVHTCLNVTSPYAEGNYTYPSFADYVSGKRTPVIPTDWKIHNSGNLSFTQTGVPPPQQITTTTLVATSTTTSGNPQGTGKNGTSLGSQGKSSVGKLEVGLGGVLLSLLSLVV